MGAEVVVVHSLMHAINMAKRNSKMGYSSG
jgi:hypothetical protein